jgi:hypothetical protein
MDITRSFTTDAGKTKKAVWTATFETGQDLIDRVILSLGADVVARHICYGIGIDNFQRDFKPIFDKNGIMTNKPENLGTFKARVEKVFGQGNCTVTLDVDKNVPDEKLKVAKSLASQLPTDTTDEEMAELKAMIEALKAKRAK